VNPDRITPGPGQESVWDYPRPPRVETTDAVIEIRLGGLVIARTTSALRVLETSHPPTYYLPLDDAAAGALAPTAGASWCEYKGLATYLDVIGGRVAAAAAWTYADPLPGYTDLVGHVAIYRYRMDEVTADDEPVQPQPGGFYGGWITSRVSGPFKGAPGTQGW